jgi:hypothetical protein
LFFKKNLGQITATMAVEFIFQKNFVPMIYRHGGGKIF